MKDLRKELQQQLNYGSVDSNLRLYTEQLVERIIKKNNQDIINSCFIEFFDGVCSFELIHNGFDTSVEFYPDRIELDTLCPDHTSKEKTLKLNKHSVVSAYAWIRSFFSA